MPLCHILCINTVVVLAIIDDYDIGNMCLAKYDLPPFLFLLRGGIVVILAAVLLLFGTMQKSCKLCSIIMSSLDSCNDLHKITNSNQNLYCVKSLIAGEKFCMQCSFSIVNYYYSVMTVLNNTKCNHALLLDVKCRCIVV